MRDLSVVITVMNEEDNIYPLVDAIRDALNGMDYEVIFVDDGSTDATRLKIKKLRTKHGDDCRNRLFNRKMHCLARW
jgi:glycosyltransferase involved in cell wall biosynthesis